MKATIAKHIHSNQPKTANHTGRENMNRNKSELKISSKSNFCSISISKYRMNRDAEFGSKLFCILDDFKLHYRHIPAGVDSLDLILGESQLDESVEEQLIERIYTELSADRVTIKRNLSLIVLIGRKMDHQTDNITKAAKALADNEINIEMINMNQGPSELSLLLAVQDKDERRAIKAIHDEFFSSAGQ